MKTPFIKSLFLVIFFILSLSFVPIKNPRLELIKKEKINPNDKSILKDASLEFIDALEGNGYHGSMLLYKEGNEFIRKNFGYSNINKKEKLNSNSVFPLDSSTKHITAFLIYNLYKTNQLKYDERLGDIFQELNKTGLSDITVGELVNHRSGLARYPSVSSIISGIFVRGDNSKSATPSYLQKTKMYSSKKGQFNYSETGFVFLKLIIEKYTGKSYENVLKEQVFEPADMRNSSVYKGYPGFKVNGYLLATPFFSQKTKYINIPYLNFSRFKGAYGVNTTANDMIKWFTYLHNNHKTFLDFTQSAYTDKVKYSNGLNFSKYSSNSSFYSHHGYEPGYFSGFSFADNNDFIYIMFSNTTPIFIDRKKSYNPNSEFVNLITGKDYRLLINKTK